MMSISYFHVVAVWCVALATGICSAARPTATTETGPVFGFTANGTDAFRGIPYAAPPTGENRFRPPQPVGKPWSSPRDATRFGASCIQMGSPGTGEKGQPLQPAWNSINLTVSSEDCLFVNVYTPAGASAKAAPGPGHPVMFYMHAESSVWQLKRPRMRGLTSTSTTTSFSSRPTCGSAFLVLRRWIRCATATRQTQRETTACRIFAPPYAGCKRISMPLETLPRVTIFGESSGGSSVAFHLTSLKSRGLFQRAILESPGVTQYKTWDAMSTNTEYAASILTASGSNGCAYPAMEAAKISAAATTMTQVSTAFRSVEGLTFFSRSASLTVGSYPTRAEAQSACVSNPKCFMVTTGQGSPYSITTRWKATIGGDKLVAGNLQNVEIYMVNVSVYGLGNASDFIVDVLASQILAQQRLASLVLRWTSFPSTVLHLTTTHFSLTLPRQPWMSVELSVPLSELSRSKDAPS